MGNGQWEMGNGKWEMGNGKWEMGNGQLNLLIGKDKSKINFNGGKIRKRYNCL